MRVFQAVTRAIVAGLAGMALLVQPASATITVGSWQPIYCGVAYATGSADGAEPRLQQVRALRIDLQAPGVEFFATPSNGSSAKDTTTARTSSFLRTHGLQAAINAGFFDFSLNLPLNADIDGLHVSRGTVVSEATNGFGNCILRITADNVATFGTVTALPYSTAGIYTAVPGSHFILVNGVGSTDTSQVALRSLAGISADGRFLVLATIDSVGAHYKECAEWLLRFGCHNGLNLDGGGSTTLVRSDDAGGSIILNNPSGSERYVGSHLGVFAQPRPAPLSVTFDAQGGSVNPSGATVTNGLPYGSLPSPTRSGFIFGGWWTGAGAAGRPVAPATVVSAAESHTLYAAWAGTPCTVTFDAQGGSVSPASATVTNSLPYGALPSPVRADYLFGGWWTGPEGAGSQVTPATTVATDASHTLYAKWDATPALPAFAISATTGRAPFAVTFSDLSTGAITNRQWDFGDGSRTNTSATTLVHVYTNAGAYTVTLVVQGPLGAVTNTLGNPVVVHGFFENSLPFQVTFEPPGMRPGDLLLVPWNTNGWYGGPAGSAIVTNVPVAPSGAGVPVPSATHSNVLVLRDAQVTNRFSQAGGPPRTVVDFMNQAEGRDTVAPDTNVLADAQVSVFTDAEGRLNAWCSGDQDHTSRTWMVYTNVTIGETNWARLTLAFDYASDTARGLTYFSVALDGVAIPVPGGRGYAYAGGRFERSPGGTWLVSASPFVKQVNSVTFDGSGCLDDFVVTTSALDFVSFPGAGRREVKGTLLIVR